MKPIIASNAVFLAVLIALLVVLASSSSSYNDGNGETDTSIVAFSTMGDQTDQEVIFNGPGYLMCQECNNKCAFSCEVNRTTTVCEDGSDSDGNTTTVTLRYNNCLTTCPSTAVCTFTPSAASGAIRGGDHPVSIFCVGVLLVVTTIATQFIVDGF